MKKILGLIVLLIFAYTFSNGQTKYQSLNPEAPIEFKGNYIVYAHKKMQIF